MLSQKERDELLRLRTSREYPVGDRLFAEGDTTTHVVVLHSGWVKVVADAEEGGLALLALRSRGDLVGEQAALDGEPRSASVICASVVRAHVIPQPTFVRFLTGHPNVHLAVTRTLSAKLRSETRRRVNFSGLGLDVRLARVLSDLVRMNSQPAAEGVKGIEVGYPLTQPEIAAMVGVSEPSIQRALRQFRDDGVVDTGYRRIVILDMPALKRIAGPGWTSGHKSIR